MHSPDPFAPLAARRSQSSNSLSTLACQPQSAHTFEGNRVAYATLMTAHCVCIPCSWHASGFCRPFYLPTCISDGVFSASLDGAAQWTFSFIQWEVTTISQKEIYIPALGRGHWPKFVLPSLCILKFSLHIDYLFAFIINNYW